MQDKNKSAYTDISNKLLVGEFIVDSGNVNLNKEIKRKYLISVIQSIIEQSEKNWTLRKEQSLIDNCNSNNFKESNGRLTKAGIGAEWAEAGYPILEATNEQYAAALMCTYADGLLLCDIHMPAKVIAFTSPPGNMISPFCGMLVAGGLGNTSLEVIFPDQANELQADTLDELLFVQAEKELREEDYERLPKELIKSERVKRNAYRLATVSEQRRFDLIRNYIIGLLIAYQQKSNHQYTGLQLSRAKKLREFAPHHRVALIGQSTKADMRRFIRRYLDGEIKRSPMFQFIVRGHYRDQAYGPNHSLRETIWIEPYWKGPEEGLIRARAVRFQST
jgi:hypothetical protein